MENTYNTKKEFLNIIINKNYYKFLKTKLKQYRQHGKTTTFKHCRDVAYNSYLLAKFIESKFNISVDISNLVCSAYMHDMFLYDWHEKANWHRLHGYTHANVAMQNAILYCNANEKEQNIIKTHMWPLNLTKVPKSKEAWIVSLCDKYTATKEVIDATPGYVVVLNILILSNLLLIF